MELLEEYKEINLNKIKKFISDGQEENINLEFKKGINLKNRDDRKIFAQAISGFANSNGGIVVWGIDARKNEEGIDCACELKEIENLKLFISLLNEFTGQAISPILDSVKHKAIFSAKEKTKGFAVTLIPESFSGPHMAKLGEDRYYKRSGDSFYKMEHFDLEGMFGRRKKPILNLFYRIAADQIVLGIKNEGRGTAKAPFLAFNCSRPYIRSRYGVDGNGMEGLPRLHHAGQILNYRYGGNSTIVIHPGTMLEVAAIEIPRDKRNLVNNINELVINYEITAEDAQLIKNRIEIK